MDDSEKKREVKDSQEGKCMCVCWGWQLGIKGGGEDR